MPSGPFLSGRDKEEKEIEGFYIDIFPVTNAEFRKFVDAHGYRRSTGRLRPEPRTGRLTVELPANAMYVVLE